MNHNHSIDRLVCAITLLMLGILSCRSTPNPPSWTKAQVLSDKEDHPSKIVTDGDGVYYITGGTIASQHEGTNNIKRVSQDGSVSLLVKGGAIIPDEMLAIDDKNLYWSHGGN